MSTGTTQLEQLEEALQVEHIFVKTILETLKAVVIVLDSEGRVVNINKACESILGYANAEINGKYLWELPFILGESDSIKEKFYKIKEGDYPGEAENYWLAKEGKPKYISWTYTVVGNNRDISYVIGTGIDITEQKKLEAERMLAIMEGQERERKRLAEELHDGLAPLLSTVKINLSALEPDIEKIKTHRRKNFHNAKSLLDRSLNEIRTMSKDISPQVLETYGLVIAIRDLCEKINQAQEVELSFYAVGVTDRMPNSIEIGLYRAAQELINNALKHANAKKITLQLIGHEASVVLTIEDDGTGFDLSLATKGGLGLKNIESRAELLNGIFIMDSSVGRGTSASIEIPLNN